MLYICMYMIIILCYVNTICVLEYDAVANAGCQVITIYVYLLCTVLRFSLVTFVVIPAVFKLNKVHTGIQPACARLC